LNVNKSLLILGDIFAILLVTVIGFATHGEVGAGSPSPNIVIPRMAVVFLPLAITWFLLAPWFGLFQLEITTSLKQLWRPVFVMLYAAPLAVVLRGLILNAAIIPVFAVVLTATSAFGMLVWRGIYFLLSRKDHK
jgi:hypothetical protein